MRGGRCLVVAGLAQGVGEPFETFVETVPRGGAGGLNVLCISCQPMYRSQVGRG
jgi:hypothetical protein